MNTQLAVLGAGPGGYTAAFRAADLGLQVTLIERYPALGGVCLNVGCIPSKALLHMAGALEEARALGAHGIAFGEPAFDWTRIRARKNEVVAGLTRGLAALAKRRKVKVLTGAGHLAGPNELSVETADGPQALRFEHAILATGSQPVKLPALPGDPRVLDSTSALEIAGPPGHLLVVGGGVIGLEMATVYLAFGWKVSIAELQDHLLDGVDPDLVRPLEKRLRARCEAIHLGAALTEAEARDDGLHIRFAGENAPAPARYDRVLVAVGRAPNSAVGLDAAGVATDERGFVTVDEKLRSSVPHIFAIGDLTGPPLLAHRAMHQGKVAAEVIAGEPAAFDARCVPSVAYTDPEIAWAGLSEAEAKQRGVDLRKGIFPWSASGRALGSGRGEGHTKLLFAAEDNRLLGAGIVGPHAGELIAEATLAIELGADASDLGLTIHPHPTLSESLAIAAEAATQTATDLPPPKKR